MLMPALSIQTAFVHFPIGIVFVDRELKVVKIASVVVPWRTASARHARHALELPAGEAARWGIAVGDQLAIGETEDMAIARKAMADGAANDPFTAEQRLADETCVPTISGIAQAETTGNRDPALPKSGSFHGLINGIEYAQPQIEVHDDVRG